MGCAHNAIARQGAAQIGEVIMAARWLYDTTACVDCYLTAGVGAPSDDPDYVPAVVPLSSVAPGERVELGWRFPTEGMRENPDGECVLGFSWNPCECCGSTLGGDRFAVSMWTLG